MSAPIGFVILVNPRNPLAQTERLIGTLNRLFDAPPIVCHLDLGQNAGLPGNLTPNVRVVRPHVATRWGDFSCVEAFIKALELLYAGGTGPEWFVFLSGADYPIKPARQILGELREGKFDGYVEHRLVSTGDFTYPPDPLYPRGYKGSGWLRYCHRRYCSWRLDVRGLNRYLRPSTRTFWIERPRSLVRTLLPFSTKFECYAGEVWFAANHGCAERILHFHEHDSAVAAHYRKTLVPEESYIQSVLANASHLHLSQNHLRYVDWTAGGSNPRVLGKSDLPLLLASPAHFARKLNPDDQETTDELDRLICI